MKNKLKMVLSFYYITVLAIVFLNVDNLFKNIAFIVFLVIFSSIYYSTKHKKLKGDIKKIILKIGTLLFLMMLGVSVLILFITNKGFLIPDNLITIGMILISMFVAYYTNEYFGKRNIKYIAAALAIGYGVNLIIYLFCDFLDMEGLELFGLSIGHTIELHELAFIAGIVLIYLICSKDRNVLLTIIISLIFLLDFKRIGLLGLLVVIGLILLDKYIIKNRNKVIIITKCATYLFVCIYLLVITVFPQQLFGVMNDFGINMSWRDQFYMFILSTKSQYAPFLGTGIRSTDYALSISPQWNIVSAIHSDILRLYIENGIIIFVIYLVTFISTISNRIRKHCGIDVQHVYNLLILFTFICYATDNLFTYYRFIFVLFALIFLLVSNKTIARDKR